MKINHYTVIIHVYALTSCFSLDSFIESSQTLVCRLVRQFLSMYQAKDPPEIWTITNCSLPQKIHLQYRGKFTVDITNFYKLDNYTDLFSGGVFITD